MRTVLALLLAIAAFFGTDYGLQRLGEATGVKSRVTYSEPLVREAYDQEYEDFGGTTTFGYAVAAFSAVIAVWVAKAISSGSAWKHTFSEAGRRYWLAWLAGTATIVLLFAVSNLMFSNTRFPFKGPIWLLLESAALVTVAFIAHRWTKARPHSAEDEA
jgi:hypothetical protein